MIILRKKNIGLTLGWKTSAGLICFWFNVFSYNLTFHFIVSKKHWIFGFEDDYYEGPIKLFGLGPICLFCLHYL